MEPSSQEKGGEDDIESGCTCKVGRIQQKYSIPNLDDELVAYWTAPDDRMSLRELAEYFNRAVLEAAVAERGSVPLPEEVDTWYDLLADPDVISSSRTQVHRELQRRGVDVEAVLDDFVSYQSINRHLKNCRGVDRDDPEETDAEYVDRRMQSVYALENKLKAILTSTLEQLDRSGRIALSEFAVTINVTIVCSSCNRSHTLADVVETGGCDCETGG